MVHFELMFVWFECYWFAPNRYGAFKMYFNALFFVSKTVKKRWKEGQWKKINIPFAHWVGALLAMTGS